MFYRLKDSFIKTKTDGEPIKGKERDNGVHIHTP